MKKLFFGDFSGTFLVKSATIFHCLFFWHSQVMGRECTEIICFFRNHFFFRNPYHSKRPKWPSNHYFAICIQLSHDFSSIWGIKKPKIETFCAGKTIFGSQNCCNNSFRWMSGGKRLGRMRALSKKISARKNFSSAIFRVLFR